MGKLVGQLRSAVGGAILLAGMVLSISCQAQEVKFGEGSRVMLEFSGEIATATASVVDAAESFMAPTYDLALREPVEAETNRLAKFYFGEVVPKSVEANASRGEFVFGVKLTSPKYDSAGWHHFTFSYELGLVLKSPAGKTVEKAYRRKTTGPMPWSSWSQAENDRNMAANLPPTIPPDLKEVVEQFFASPDVTALVEEELLAAASPEELAGLQAVNASYRISASEGMLRTKPDAKVRAIKKLPIGSVVQISGRLPSGWLQVSVGERRAGWLREDEVRPVIPPSEWPAVANELRKRSKAQKPAQLEEARKYFSIAFKLFQGGDFAAARTAFEKGLALDGGNGMARFYLAENMVRMKDNGAAYEQYGLAKELLPAASGEAVKAETALAKLQVKN